MYTFVLILIVLVSSSCYAVSYKGYVYNATHNSLPYTDSQTSENLTLNLGENDLYWELNERRLRVTVRVGDSNKPQGQCVFRVYALKKYDTPHYLIMQAGDGSLGFDCTNMEPDKMILLRNG